MTKYILAGGCDRLYPDYGSRLAEVILREVEKPTILSCMFSQEPDRRAQKHEHFDEWFVKYFGSQIKILHEDESSFFQQLNEADVVYLHGGTTRTLLENLPNFKRFKEAVSGKIVIGSSAGANYLSSVCYSPSINQTMEGTGIVDVGVVVHYGIEQFDDTKYSYEQWQNAAREVEMKAKDRPTLLLPEGTFAIIKQ